MYLPACILRFRERIRNKERNDSHHGPLQETIAMLVLTRKAGENIRITDNTLAELFAMRGVPRHIRSDNGSEFIARAIQRWFEAGPISYSRYEYWRLH